MFDTNAFMILYKKLLEALAEKRMENSVLRSGNKSLAARVKELEDMLSVAMELGEAALDETPGGSTGNM